MRKLPEPSCMSNALVLIRYESATQWSNLLVLSSNLRVPISSWCTHVSCNILPGHECSQLTPQLPCVGFACTFRLPVTHIACLSGLYSQTKRPVALPIFGRRRSVPFSAKSAAFWLLERRQCHLSDVSIKPVQYGHKDVETYWQPQGSDIYQSITPHTNF